VDFAGAPIGSLGDDNAPGARITASRGAVKLREVVRVEETGRWRVEFDLLVEGPETVDLRAFLERNGAALSETWLYRLDPADWAAVLQLGG
jgi:glucans biosynthesis protein